MLSDVEFFSRWLFLFKYSEKVNLSSKDALIWLICHCLVMRFQG